jgi:hypothetical protein
MRQPLLGEPFAVLGGDDVVRNGIAVAQVDVPSGSALALERPSKNLLEGFGYRACGNVGFRFVRCADLQDSDSFQRRLLGTLAVTPTGCLWPGAARHRRRGYP